MKKIFLFFLVLFFSPLFSEEPVERVVDDIENYSALIDFDANPSSIVDGCVNVITGHYFENENDIVTPGTNPVVLTRSFSSGDRHKGELYDLWDLNLTSKIKVDGDSHHSTVMFYDRGAEIPFQTKDRQTKPFFVPNSVFSSGIVNVPIPYLSGKTYLKNKTVEYVKEDEKKRYLLKTPGDDTLNFAKRHSSSRYLLSDLTHSNGNTLRYTYDEDDAVSAIGSYNLFGQLVGELNIDRKDEKDEKTITVTSNNNKKITYSLSKMKSKHRNGSGHRYCLTSVDSNFGPPIRYGYHYNGKHKRESLSRKNLPDGRFLKIKYADGKVKSLMAPLGVDNKPIAFRKFEYSSRQATVFDAYKNKKVYKWKRQKRLTSIEEYTPDGLYRTEELIWGKRKEKTFLSKTLCSLQALIVTHIFVKLLILRALIF